MFTSTGDNWFNRLPKRAQVLLMMGLVFLVTVFVLIHQYNLWGAHWGGVSVVLAAPFLTLPGLGIFWYLGLFRPTSPTPKWFLNVVFFYTIATLFAGSWLMQPSQTVSTEPAPYFDTRTSYYQSRAYSYYGDVFGNLLDNLWGPDPAVVTAPVPVTASDDADDSSSSSNKSDDSDSEVWIYIIAFAVLVVYLIGAFIVPGFWIVSAMLGCFTMLGLAWKEYQYGSDSTAPLAEALFKALKKRGF